MIHSSSDRFSTDLASRNQQTPRSLLLKRRLKKRNRFQKQAIWLVLGLSTLFISPTATAQFSSGSTGADGALDFTGTAPDTTVIFDPAEFDPPLDPEGDNVYHFTTITIPEGVTVRLSAEILGTIPIIWLASGAVQIDGIIDLNGEGGHSGQSPHLPSVAGAGGYGGGTGATRDLEGRAGDGPGGGQIGSNGGGAGHALDGQGGVTRGFAYGNAFLLPLLGGSGGAGGNRSGQRGGGGGGAGGGGILIASSVSIAINGTVIANGGNGGPGEGGFNGGGGSGGAIRIMSPIINGTGTISAQGGTGTGVNAGSFGRIRLEAFRYEFTGTINPSPNLVSPGIVFLPENAPTVRVLSVGGIDIPENPGGSFVTPDATIDEPSDVDLTIECRFIPPGTVVNIRIVPETGAAQEVESTPLEGTIERSTATASVRFSHAFSRIFVFASWTP